MKELTIYHNAEYNTYLPFGITDRVLFNHLSDNYYLLECELEPFRLLAEAHGWKVTILI